MRCRLRGVLIPSRQDFNPVIGWAAARTACCGHMASHSQASGSLSTLVQFPIASCTVSRCMKLAGGLCSHVHQPRLGGRIKTSAAGRSTRAHAGLPGWPGESSQRLESSLHAARRRLGGSVHGGRATAPRLDGSSTATLSAANAPGSPCTRSALTANPSPVWMRVAATGSSGTSRTRGPCGRLLAEPLSDCGELETPLD